MRIGALVLLLSYAGQLPVAPSAGLPAVTPSATEGQEINSITIEVTTADVTWAGTDNDVHLVLGTFSAGNSVPHDWKLDNAGDDFEQGDTNTFRSTTELPERVCDIIDISIWKSADHWYDTGGWKLGGVRIYYNDDPSLLIYHDPNINKWLEDDDLSWDPADFYQKPCPSPGGCASYICGPLDAVDPLTDSDCDGIADEEDPKPKEPADDSDGDGIPDPRELRIGTDPNNPDTDGDGIPDGLEDRDKNGCVDPGETDAFDPDTDGDGIPDFQEDADGDGTPDWAEFAADPDNADVDGDGWADACANVRTSLILTQVKCRNEEEDVGEDELFVVVDDVRFPVDIEGLDGAWDMEGGDVVYPDPGIVVATRVHSPTQPADYRAVIELWEDDWFDWSDDPWQTETISFGESGRIVVERRDLHWYDDTIYDVTFRAISECFEDPDPTRADADGDQDGLSDEQEHELSGDFRGLGDPASPDIFLELDWVGDDQEPEPYSKIDVVSQFYYHGYPIHLDDGDFGVDDGNFEGGGENLPYGEKVYLRTSKGSPSAEEIADDGHFATDRRGKFHYVLAVDVVGEADFGQASGPHLNDDGDIVSAESGLQSCTGHGSRVGLMTFKSDYLNHVSDMESILFMHELGHTLGLCHRPGDPRPSVVEAPHCEGTEQTDCGRGPCWDCSHYWIDQDSDTAMGQSSGHWYFLWIDMLADAVDREINYEDAEWDALELRGIRYW